MAWRNDKKNSKKYYAVKERIMAKYQVRLPNNRDFIFELEAGDVVIDCGANIGNVTDFFQKLGAKVTSFEPNPDAFKVLKNRFENNANVDCVNKGVGSSSDAGMKKLFLHESSNSDPLTYSTGCSIVGDKVNVDNENFIDTEIIDMGLFIKNLDAPVKVLKIDIEGAEVSLLNDLADKGLLRSIPYVFVETHEKKVPSLVEPTRLLRERLEKEGYDNVNLNWI